MALFFFDSSALVRRYVQEQGSVWVREITANTMRQSSQVVMWLTIVMTVLTAVNMMF
jgi:predicted nucleic acid-binding protein